MVNKKFLLLKRQKGKAQAGTWCLPGGKVEDNETYIVAIQREVLEEIGIYIPFSSFVFEKSVQVTHDYEINYHIFTCVLDLEPQITLDIASHSDFTWIDPEGAMKRDDLIQDGTRTIQEIFHI